MNRHAEEGDSRDAGAEDLRTSGHMKFVGDVVRTTRMEVYIGNGV